MRPEEKEPLVVERARPYPLGAFRTGGGLCFAAAIKKKGECGLLLYRRGRTRPCHKIPFTEDFRTGDVYAVCVKGIRPEDYCYNFYNGDEVFTDPYAARIVGRERWGALRDGGERKLFSGISAGDYQWEGDRPLHLKYDDCIDYLIHARGFTEHVSSKCENRGTFGAVKEKIPYLKELGINQLELMPAYEFEESIAPARREVRDPNILDYMEKEDEDKRTVRIDYWGYREGGYFAPKASYSAGDPVVEFKDMVKALHRNGIELIMQFFFPAGTNHNLIQDVIKYWVLEYHIDGVHLLGIDLPVRELATSPLLARTKILCEGFPLEEIYRDKEIPEYKNLAVYNDAFLYDIRRILKSDENQLPAFVNQLRKNPDKTAAVNYISSYNTLTLMDMVSYDRKHNEANLEENRDGSDYNVSWNCGAEGPTRKKAITALRMRQIRNALTVLMLSQGTPMVQSGDEFGHTRKGNNNPYCQDNAISWLNWNFTETGGQIFRFVKALIRFRKRHPVLHGKTQMQMMDLKACGYPELSYHGESAWYAKFNGYDRHIGVMYSGRRLNEAGEEDDFFYLACNFHWEAHKLALPRLPKKFEWYVAIHTDDKDAAYIYESGEEKVLENQSQLLVPPRTVIVLIGREEKSGSEQVEKQDKKNTSVETL